MTYIRGYYHLVASLVNARHIKINYLDPETIINKDGEQWIVFPWFKKIYKDEYWTSTEQGATDSGNFGWAVKRRHKVAFQFIQGCQYGYKQFEENWDWDARGVLDKTLLVNTIFNFASIFTPTKQLLYAQHNCYFVMSVYDDVYGYVHVLPNYINVGTVLVDKIYSTELWNANLTKQETLVSLGQTNTDGILFEGHLHILTRLNPWKLKIIGSKLPWLALQL